MTDIPDFPALVELAQRLKGKDRKTCELALYTLKKQDERLAKRDDLIAEMHARLLRFEDMIIRQNEIIGDAREDFDEEA